MHKHLATYHGHEEHSDLGRCLPEFEGAQESWGELFRRHSANRLEYLASKNFDPAILHRQLGVLFGRLAVRDCLPAALQRQRLQYTRMVVSNPNGLPRRGSVRLVIPIRTNRSVILCS